LGGKKSGRGFNFTVTFNGITRSLNTQVKVESTVNSNDTLEVMSLWDTGASCSMIRPEVAAKLNLKVLSKTLMSTPSDKNVPTNVYLINISLPNGARIVDVRALEGTPNNCDILIGMDVINLGDFAVTNNNGHTMFSFRIPSMTEIDFCKHSYMMPVKNENKKVGRNDPCPCGSGKKNKFCCGR
jgi:predicted aspartyl protease